LPFLESLENHFKDKPFHVVMIDAGESLGTVQSLMVSKGYTFQVLLDQDGSVSQRYHILSHPIKFLLDKKGNLVFSSIGFREWDTPEMIAAFQQVVNEL
jgi:hypothetical protein